MSRWPLRRQPNETPPATTPPARAVRELAADLLPSTQEISGRLVDHLTATLPELAADDDEELHRELLTSDDPVELTCALTLAAALGPAVLTDAVPSG